MSRIELTFLLYYCEFIRKYTTKYIIHWCLLYYWHHIYCSWNLNINVMFHNIENNSLSSLNFNFRSTWPDGNKLSSNSKSSNQNVVFINVTFWLDVSSGVSRKFYCHEALSQFDFARTCIVKKFRCCFYFISFCVGVVVFVPSSSIYSKLTLVQVYSTSFELYFTLAYQHVILQLLTIDRFPHDKVRITLGWTLQSVSDWKKDIQH